MAFELPKLPYATDALEPYIDSMTMQIHHAKHHQAYLDKLNGAIEGINLATHSIEDILKVVSNYELVVRNNGGGYYNHNLFWKMLTPHADETPTGEIITAINEQLGGVDQFKEIFTKVALDRFGSGWAWLCKKNTGELFICSTANQDNPIMDVVDEETKGIPLLGLDVWEHAYYLSYQNRRAEYIEAFWHVVNWKEVNQRFLLATL
jgi:Fe-Mn family superoxide dismutase